MRCDEKKIYKSFSEARLAANKLDPRDKYKTQHVYECDVCGQFHLSSMARKEYKTMIKRKGL